VLRSRRVKCGSVNIVVCWDERNATRESRCRKICMVSVVFYCTTAMTNPGEAPRDRLVLEVCVEYRHHGRCGLNCRKMKERMNEYE
jgi:hypothetical protein